MSKKLNIVFFNVGIAVSVAGSKNSGGQASVWTKEKANAWYASQRG
jgi:hypothetical protein